MLNGRRNTASEIVEDIVQPTDIIVSPLGVPGNAIDKGQTIKFLHALQLEIYRTTVQNGGDGYLPRSPPFRRVFDYDLELDIVTTEKWGLSLGQALFAIQSILHDMLYPVQKSYGFLERIWAVFDISSRGPKRKLGTVRLFNTSVALEYACTLLYFDDSSSLIRSFSDANSSMPSPLVAGLRSRRLSLAAVPGPWNVPGTSMTLYFSSRELGLPPEYVIWPLNILIGCRWISFASTQRVGRVGEIVSTDDSDTVQVTMKPRMEPPIPYQPLTTDTDVVEAAVGIVFFMLTHGFFTTKIIVLRPNERGLRIPVGDIEILDKRFPFRRVGSGNLSSIETA